MGIRLGSQNFNYDLILNTDRSDVRYPRYIRNESTKTITVPFNSSAEEPIVFGPGAIFVADMGVATMFAGDFKELKVYEQDPGAWKQSAASKEIEIEDVGQELLTDEEMDTKVLPTRSMIELRRIARKLGVVAKVGETKAKLVEDIKAAMGE